MIHQESAASSGEIKVPKPISPSSSPPAATENLRCPRCDSTNTKFCYYNNYNLTQPRHFCKTCRRYWTKGGALRNVPIGGGCRKNKTSSPITSSSSSSSVANKLSSNAVKLKTTTFSSSAEIGKSTFISSLEHELYSSNSNPILWPNQNNSHLLSLLRPNPNLNPNPISSESAVGRIFGLDAFGLTVNPNSVWRNNNNHHHQQQQQQNNGGVILGLEDFYQRVRSSTSNQINYQDASIIGGNMGITTEAKSSSTLILESAPVGAGVGGTHELMNYSNSSSWSNNNNPAVFSWSDLPTTHGTAYPS
ncbi:hypothetical protein M9H77_15746 [Catharanthus roseus]|uniref:Uncharacterized protein n=1 Tax=Catharanthus roseus TaxID=4058 RepID=A0ACC0AY22_CATRO|nr:hypothetical protein M9H77_15746 [Catharanthus roseus]